MSEREAAGALLGALTRQQRDTLWWKMTCAASEVTAELDKLTRLPWPTRDYCYGPGILEATAGVRDDLLDLLDSEIPGDLRRLG
jgi:hypothetical protein